MSGSKMKGRAKGDRILLNLTDSQLTGKQALLAAIYGVSEGTICRERKLRMIQSKLQPAGEQ